MAQFSEASFDSVLVEIHIDASLIRKVAKFSGSFVAVHIYYSLASRLRHSAEIWEGAFYLGCWAMKDCCLANCMYR